MRREEAATPKNGRDSRSETELLTSEGPLVGERSGGPASSH